MKYLTLLLMISLVCPAALWAQTPAPGDRQTEPIYLTNVVVHVGDGTVIEKGVVGFTDGKLSAVGSITTTPVPDGANARDLNGAHVYPSLIAPSTSLGLVEIGAVRATRDENEVGALNPNVRSLIAFNTDSRVIPTIRSNGILLAQITPTGGRIPGTSSLVHFDAWNWRDAAVLADDGIHLNWPRMTVPAGADEDEKKKMLKARAQQLQELRDLFVEARAYGQIVAPQKRNLRLEALSLLWPRKTATTKDLPQRRLFIDANDARSILAALNFAVEFDVKPIIVGGADSWLLTDQLKQAGAAVVYQPTHRLPRRRHEAVDQPYKTPAILHEAGIPFCLSGSGSWDVRNLPFLAGTAAAYGLDREQAVVAMTSGSAQILGIDDQVGTLHVGKSATLFVSEGDVLDMRSNNVLHAFVDGREVDLSNKQKELYLKFSKKYGLESPRP